MANFTNIKQLTESDFEYFRNVVYQESGIKLSDMKKALMQSRIMRRLRYLRLPNYESYKEYLQTNYDEEIVHFVNAVTTNKTDFFRENQHFEFLSETVLPEKVNKKQIRIWSAGCSTGEEPYSIAITLKEFLKDKSIDAKILATDIDTTVLEHAYRGIYKYETVQNIKPDILKKYFYRGSGDNEGMFKVKDSVKELVTFKRLNLQMDKYPMKKKFDIIFCRNVIIYFDKETQRKLFNKYYDYLDNDGYLFIGHSENLSGVTEKFKHLGRTIYRKNY